MFPPAINWHLCLVKLILVKFICVHTIKSNCYFLYWFHEIFFHVELILYISHIMCFSGSVIGFCVCFLVCCRMKTQKKRGRKRNTASDVGDGDYLVNGMYLWKFKLEMKCYISSEKEPISIKSTPDANLKRLGDVQECLCV